MMGILTAVLGVGRWLRAAVMAALRLFVRPVRLPLGLVIGPAALLALLWWRADGRADRLARRLAETKADLATVRADLATARANSQALSVALDEQSRQVRDWRRRADEAAERAARAQEAARAARARARAEADRILMTEIPRPAADGPSIEECRAVDRLLREELFR